MVHLTDVRLDSTLRLLLPLPQPVLVPVPRVVSGLVGRVRHWPVASQQVARRNAMVACTALADRRAEREDVESYLRGLQVAAHG